MVGLTAVAVNRVNAPSCLPSPRRWSRTGPAVKRGITAKVAVQSVQRLLKKYDASGAAMAMMTTVQINEASTGCCIGQALITCDGFGLFHRWRTPAQTAETGFQSVMACIQPGMCAVGTMELETKAKGNSTMKPNEAADSGLLAFSPTHWATQVSE